MAKSSFAERNKAVREAWNKELELVKEGKGTRDWTPEQQKDILEKGRAYDENGKAFEGQHMKSAEVYPEYQGNPENIQFLTRAEHLEAHDGNWQNPTNWYYNPITKEKISFGDGPVIPCEIIQLQTPIIEIQIEQVQETARAQKEDNTVKKELSHANNTSKSTTGKSEPKLSFGNQLKIGFKKIGKAVVEFPAKHPTVMKVMKEVGIAAATITAAAVAESSKKRSADSSHSPSEDVYVKDYDNFPASDNDCSDNVPNINNDYSDCTPVSNNGYTPNDVPAGKQRYHYKDGSVKLVEKKPYHRGGNNDK